MSNSNFVLGIHYDVVSDVQKLLHNLYNEVNFPKKALWKTSEFDIPVEVVGVIGKQDGVVFYQIKDSSTGISEKELVFG
jgi:hypothetical protein